MPEAAALRRWWAAQAPAQQACDSLPHSLDEFSPSTLDQIVACGSIFLGVCCPFCIVHFFPQFFLDRHAVDPHNFELFLFYVKISKYFKICQ